MVRLPNHEHYAPALLSTKDFVLQVNSLFGASLVLIQTHFSCAPVSAIRHSHPPGKQLIRRRCYRSTDVDGSEEGGKMLLRVAIVQLGTFAKARFVTLATERGKFIISSATPHKIKLDPRTGGGTLTSERSERTSDKEVAGIAVFHALVARRR